MTNALQNMDISLAAELVKLETMEQFEEETKRLQHAVYYYFNQFQRDGVTVYSMRQNGASVLTLSVQPEGYTDHIVGMHNRPPTEEEVIVLNRLFSDAGIENRYTGPKY